MSSHGFAYRPGEDYCVASTTLCHQSTTNLKSACGSALPLPPVRQRRWVSPVTEPSAPLWATATVAALVGALVGSFLNVVVYRVPRRLSVVSPGSFCPTCRRALAWWENVPVLGWLALRGRCRTCKAPIAARYPLVEGGNAAMWALIDVAAGGRQVVIPLCILSSTVVTIWLIEIDGHRSPRSVGAVGTGLAVVATAIAALVVGNGPLTGVLLGTTGGIVAYLVLVAVDRSASTWAVHGRTALLPAGPLLGALPLGAALAGAATIAVVTGGAAITGALVSRAPVPARHRPGGDTPSNGQLDDQRDSHCSAPAQPDMELAPEAASGCGGACTACGSAGACVNNDLGRVARRRLPDLGVLAGAVILGGCVALAVAVAVPPALWP